MAEVRVMAEGTLRLVQASGSGASWATASAPASALMGFCKSFSYTSAQTVTTISERGIPNHNKITEKAPIDVTFQLLWTGVFPTAASGASATVPMWHLEHRASAAEIAAGSAFYHQFYGGALQSIKFTEATDGNTIDLTYRCLGMNGGTASGYIA